MITLLRKLEASDEARFHGASPGVDSFLAKGLSSSRMTTGRAAVGHVIRVCGLRAGDKVLLPGYIAEGVISPILRAGLKPLFYRLNPDLSPDLVDVARLLGETSQIRLAVIVHMFGFGAPVKEFRKLVRSHGITVLEDCAHSLFCTYRSGEPFGSHGDIALYSLNKFLPVPDGAILVSHRAEIDVSLDEDALPSMPEAATEAYLEHLRLNGRVLRAGTSAEALELLVRSGEAYERYYSQINSDLSLRRQSARACLIERSIDCEKLIETRRVNTRYLMEHLKNPRLRLLVTSLPDRIVPMAVPAMVEGDKRDAFVASMMQRGVHLPTLVAKWDFLPDGERQKFAVELDFMKRHVLLPISEFLTQEDMKAVVTALNAGLNGPGED